MDQKARKEYEKALKMALKYGELIKRAERLRDKWITKLKSYDNKDDNRLGTA